MFISPLKISTLAKRGGLTGLNKIFASYNFTNMWSSENIDISGTNTTLLDYAGEHDLVNPAAANQPTFNASSANFNNKPSFTFDGINHFLEKATAFRSDTSGVVISVYKSLNAAVTISDFAFSITSSATANIYTSQVKRSDKFNPVVRRGGTSRDIRGTQTIANNSNVIGYASNGSAYKLAVNGVEDTTFTVTTLDNGDWLSWLAGIDTMQFGGINNGGTQSYSNIELVFNGYLPYTDVATILAVQNELKAYYGI